jgi:hypothetical protein
MELTNGCFGGKYVAETNIATRIAHKVSQHFIIRTNTIVYLLRVTLTARITIITANSISNTLF